jgi:hypothetical protein
LRLEKTSNSATKLSSFAQGQHGWPFELGALS